MSVTPETRRAMFQVSQTKKSRDSGPCANLFENKSLVPTFGEIH